MFAVVPKNSIPRLRPQASPWDTWLVSCPKGQAEPAWVWSPGWGVGVGFSCASCEVGTYCCLHTSHLSGWNAQRMVFRKDPSSSPSCSASHPASCFCTWESAVMTHVLGSIPPPWHAHRKSQAPAWL